MYSATLLDTRGAYHLTKNSEIFKTGTMGMEISWEKYQKIWKMLNFRKVNHSTENSGMKIKWNGNFQEKMFQNLGIPHEVILFCPQLSLSVLEKVCTICPWKFLEIHTRIFG